jgi:hypothetical protein
MPSAATQSGNPYQVTVVNVERSQEPGLRRWVELLADVVRGLHRDGVIVRVFLEYYDEIADRARSANPSDLVDDFCAWIEGMNQRELENRPRLSAD